MRFNLFFLSLVSLVFMQHDVSFSLESKYAQDKFSSRKNPTFFENILDVNFYLEDTYIYSQFEYSSPPLLGLNKEDFKDFLNIF